MQKKWTATGRIAGAGIALAAIAYLAYAPFFGAPFVFDDIHTIRDNPHLAHRSPLYFFANPQSASRIPATLTRPLLTFSYALDFHRAGPDPDAFRLVNLALHLLNAVLIIFLTRQTRSLRPLAVWAGILFLVHPLAGGEIGYVSNRSTLLSSSFYLAALLWYARLIRDQPPGKTIRSIRAFLPVALLYAAALLTKEVAATLPGAIALWWLAFGRDESGPTETKRAFLKFTLIGLVITAFVLSGFLIYRQAVSAPVLFPAARPHPVWQYAASQAPVIWTYIRMMFWPVNLALEHDAWSPDGLADLWSPVFILSALGLAGGLALAGTALRRAPELGFAALFAALYLAPTSSVIPLTMAVNENRPYLSLLFFVWAVLAGVNGLKTGPYRRAVIPAAVTAALLTMTATHGRTFQSEESLWKEAVRNAPRLARPWVNLGVSYSSYGRLDAARACYERALALDPCHALALTNLGNLAGRGNDPPGAEAYYRRALECDPGHLPAVIALSDLLLERHRLREAEAVLRHGLEYHPGAAALEQRLRLIGEIDRPSP